MARILVVDDEPSMRITLKALLERDGHVVDTAADAQVACDLFLEQAYDIVLTDIIMPRMTGMELLRIIREHNQATQVIVMTGEPTVDTAVNAVKNGANDYLPKPIDKAGLLQTISRAAQIKQLQDEKAQLEQERDLYLRQLEKTIADRTHELREAQQGTVLMFSSVIEMRDPYTAGHQLRVGNLAAAIAHQMGCTDNIVDQVRITGYLHDIGKIMVPAEILTKPGRLNEFEMGLIKLHPQKGFDMVGRSSLPENIAKTIIQHHERQDGSGYPQGLTADLILVEASILTVADVVEAMMSHRPYRPALGLDAALDEIQHFAGSRYRQDVVEACVQLFEQEHYLLEDEEHLPNFSELQ